MKNKLIFLSIPIIIWILYYQILDNPLIFDSTNYFHSIHDVSWKAFYNIIMKDWLVVSRYMNTTSLTMLAPYGISAQYSFNICLHIVNTLLVWFLIRQLYERKVATMIMFFFAVNPAYFHAIGDIVERNQLLMFFFCIVQMLLYIKALKVRNIFLSILFLAGSLFMYKLSIAAKECSVAFLSIYPILSLVFRENWKRSIFYMGGLSIVGVFIFYKVSSSIGLDRYFHYGKMLKDVCPAFKETPDMLLRSIFTQSRLFFRYFLSWFLPLRTAIEMRFEFAESGAYSWLIVFIVYFLTSILLLIKNSTRKFGAGLVMAGCFFIPEFTRLRLGEMFTPYRIYHFSMGYLLIVGFFLSKIRNDLIIKTIYLWVAILALISYGRIGIYDKASTAWAYAADNIDLKNEGIKCQAFRAFGNVGAAYLKEKNIKKAEPYLLKAVNINPKYTTALANLANIYYLKQNYQLAFYFANKVIESGVKGNSLITVLLVKGHIYKSMGKHDLALRTYKQENHILLNKEAEKLKTLMEKL